MTTQPTWSAVDNDTASLLDLLAEQNPATPSEAEEWEFFTNSLAAVARHADGSINPNRLRDRIRGHVSPPRIGAFTRRALLAGLVEYSGQYVESDDVTSGNRGKPCRVLRWLGTDLPAAPSPAAGVNSEVAVRKGSQAAASVHREGVDHMRGDDTSWPT